MSQSESAKAKTPLLEQFWTLYWHWPWHVNQEGIGSQESSHLSAYLQEPCYWAAYRMVRKVAPLQFGLSDYFQIAIAQVEVVLKTYQPDREVTLRAFADLVFSTLLKDSLR